MFLLESPSDICLTLGSRLRALRLARNLSQAELAAMTGASLSSVRRLEASGQGSLVLMVTVAVAVQAGDQLERLFDQPVQSIAQAEAAQRLHQRQRARKPSLKRSPP